MRQPQLSHPSAVVLVIALCIVSAAGERFVVELPFTLGSIGVNGEVTHADALPVAHKWGFDAGGSIEGSVTLDAPANASDGFYDGDPVFLVRLVEPGTWDAVVATPLADVLTDSPPTVEKIQEDLKRLRRANCGFPALETARLNASRTAATTTRFRWDIGMALIGTVVIQQCTNFSVAATVDVTLLNKGGVQSSAELVPLLNLYATAAVVHVLVLVGFVVSLWRNRGGRVPPRVLLMLVAVMVFKTFAAVVSVLRYLSLRDDEDQGQGAIDGAARFFNFVADVVLVLTLMVLCTGFTTVRKRLRPAERNGIIGLVVLYSMFRLGSFLCGLLGRGLEASCQGAIATDTLLRVGCILVAVLFVFRLHDNLLRRLSAPWAVSLVAMRRDGNPNEPPPEPLTRFANLHTLHTIQNFKWAFVVYACIPGVQLLVTNAILNQQQPLITAVIEEFSVLYAFVIVGWHFTNLKANDAKKRSRTRPE